MINATPTATWLDHAFLKQCFDTGATYEAYLATGKEQEQANWRDFEGRCGLTTEQTSLLGGFARDVNAVVMSGTWCGDCVQQIPILKHIEEASRGRVHIRYHDRDANPELAERVRICGGARVPVVLLMNEDFDFLSFEGDRTLSRYRAMAAKNLAGACPMPGAPVPEDEVAASRQDWLDAFERAHLICRLSTKLRQRHGD